MMSSFQDDAYIYHITWKHSDECTVSKPVPLELAHPKTNMHGVSSHFEHFFLVKIEFIFSIAFPIWKAYLFLKNIQSCF